MLIVPKKSKSGNKKKEKIKNQKFNSRREAIIEDIPESLRKLWFKGDKEELKNFANWLIEQDELMSDILLADTEYTKKIKKSIESIKPANNATESIRLIHKLGKVIKRSKPKKKIGNVDLGLVRILDPNKYNKKYLDIDEYRKSLKKMADREKEEQKEIERLGYGCNKREKKFMQSTDKNKISLADAYYQKHPIRIEAE